MRMMEQITDRCVGIVDSVSAYEVKGYLLDNAPKSVSMISGSLTLFPRINGFLVIPNETGCLVGMVTWIGFNHIKSDNDVNLPKGTRMISMSILGHIVNELSGMTFERGSFSLPTVGDSILIPTSEELATIVKNDQESCITLGTSPLTGNQPVKVSVNDLFGRHIAVLGNTGSGKSCTVSGLIRWSIASCIQKIGKSPNARFIVLDPNGEYQHAFDDLKIEVLHCAVNSGDENIKQLRVPAWMWTSTEWASVFQASEKTQKPILREALRDLRTAKVTNNQNLDDENRVRIHIFQLEKFIRESLSIQSYLSNEKTKFGKEMKARVDTLVADMASVNNDREWYDKASGLFEKINAVLTERHGNYNGNEYYNIFNVTDVQSWLDDSLEIESLIGVPDDSFLINEDEPIEFAVNNLPAYIEALASGTAAGQYVDFMTARIRNMLHNSTLGSVIGNEPNMSLLTWIDSFLGSTDEQGKVCIIDLSLLPSEMVHLIVGTISRLIFEALQRYRKYYGKELPTLLVMEEAHSFIHKYSELDDNNADKLCTQIFEKIAREGRKYGMGLMISSQRPAELSQTVLSQCNSFILHRIVNDRDQDMVKRMVPDNMGNLLNELPLLPTKKAIVLGSIVAIPTIVDITNLPQNMRPKSDTPDFWNVWTEKEPRDKDWTPIVNAWQHKDTEA